jgi:hypothetical protein
METSTDKRRKSKLKAWKPKNWKPDYDRVVAYSVMGKQNTEVAVILGYTPEHISAILNSPQGLMLREKLQSALREKMLTNIPETLEYIARRGVERLKSLVDNNDVFEKHPFQVIDRTMEVLKGLNHLKGGGNGSGTINVERAVIVSGQAGTNLIEGFSKADEARRINGSTASTTDNSKREG